VWPFRKKKLVRCPRVICNFLNWLNTDVEAELETARKKDKILELECVRKNKCPDCKVKGKILAGPCGGISMNVKCGACGSEFNITPFGVVQPIS